ncbi:chromatin structure-remodeling complex protein SYD isoform X1 [Cynara cardunculus var. scolymus]|uniref:chromatin structure-remodeling complex protein SYD isoform X1 n=1 Tax=Cynara cardunculus var. scolymus TaxID=59895 RepID=UPI000D630EE9|nr:chromatin structure-remodeling complex protein SYD isoform X1 [Cynara cardunculus var. scolymus]
MSEYFLLILQRTSSMAATPQNVEMEAAKFLHKLIQESTDEPTKLATKLHVILQHMRSSGKENSMPYQVISRAMETVINQHGLDIEALMASRQPLTSGTQGGESSLSQIAGPSQQAAVENDSKSTLTAEDAAKIATFSSKPLHAGHDIYQGSANQLNSIKSHGSDAGFSGSYESAEPGNPLSMQFSNSYDNQSAAMLMHKGPAGKALEQEGRFPNVMANSSKTVQGGISNNVAEMGMFRTDASRDTGKLPVLQAPSVGPSMPFKEHHLKQLRAQCLVFLAFRNNLMPKKLHLEIALGNFFPKEEYLSTNELQFNHMQITSGIADINSKEQIDQKGKEHSIGGQSISHEVGMPSSRIDNRETERTGPGYSSSGFISETNLLKEGEKLDRMIDKNDPPSGLPEHGQGMRNNIIPRKFDAELQAFEAKELQTSATKVARADSNIAPHAGLFGVPVGEGKDYFSSQSKSHADNQGNRHGHSHLPSFSLRESWKFHSGMEGERHMVVPKNANVLEKDVILGNNHEGEDNSEPNASPASPRYTTSEKWIADCQKRKIDADYNWAVKKKKTEQRILACVEKLKETVSSSEDISAKTRSVIELKKLELLDLQHRLRSDILNDFFKPISTEMDRLKSIKKHRIGRRSKQLERYEQKMKEERQKRIRERQKDFFGELELHKERLEDVFKFRKERTKGFNKYVREFHKRKERLYREKIDRIQREKINLLKINDVEGYLRMVQDAKSDRVKQLLKETEKYLQKLGSKLKEAKVISRCFESDMNGLNDNSEFTIEDEDETDQAKHYMESNEKYYMMAHSIKETVAEQPASLIGGKLREYQMNGLRWLLSLYNNHLNGILADEMGLGKTVQVISLLCYLMENKNDRGPFLVVVPSSVLPGWETEINFWAPSINKIVYAGPPEERRRLFKERIVQQKFNVLLTTYEYLMNKHDRPKLSKIHWHYVIIDEGHRIKNASCKLNADLKHYHSSHRLLLTGTPLQNNLEELWALLNFLLPNIFNSSEDFSQWFNKPFESNADNSLEEALLSEEENLLIINRLHQVLRPFVLRRLKHKVENQLPEKIERLVRCEASAYQKILMQRVEDSLGAFGASKARAVHNSVVELRNICNHPYLSQLHTEEVHDFIPKHYLPNVIRFCGKLEMLDRLLPKLKATDHRVLLFSTMTRLLDVMEDYLYWKQYKYLRLDGHTHGGDRGALIDNFNKPGSPYFIFLLSIRAGGVGVNLQAADTVIIFDTDWNPQVDLQAQARAHRIGQKKDVLVLRLETVKTVEEQVRASAEHKLGVANQSITAGFFDNNTSAEDRREYLESLLRECKKEEAAPVLNDDALNDLIARSESEIDVFEELDKKRQEEELVVWKKLVLEQGGISSEPIPPLPSRLVTDDELKSFCEAMKAIEVPKPVVVPGIGGKRKGGLGNFDTQQYGRGKRAREVRSYEEQWTEDEFEKLCQVDPPDSPNAKEELKERDLAIVTSESGIVIGAEGGLPSIQTIQPSEDLAIQQIKEVNPPSKRGRGRPKKNTAGISSSSLVLPSSSVPHIARSVAPTVHPLGIQNAPASQLTVIVPSGSSSPSDGGQSTVALASASNATLTVPPGFQPTANHPPGFQATASSPLGYKSVTTPPPGYQKMSSPPGYQQIAPAPPGFQPLTTSPAPLVGSQVTASLVSAPLSTPSLPAGSQSTPTIPAGPQLIAASPPNHNIPPASQSNSAQYSSSISNTNLPPGTHSSATLPVGSVSLPMLPPSSPDSQSAVSPSIVTPGRGRGRGRGRPRGRGRGRGQIIESGVDVPQRRGRKPNNVVLAIPGLRASSPVSKPETGSLVVPATTSEIQNQPLVSDATAVNVVSNIPTPGTVGTPVTVSPPETSKSDIALPKTSVPATSFAASSIFADPGETLVDPDVGTTQMPLSVSVGSQPTELGTLSSQIAAPIVTVPLDSRSVSPSDTALKQGRGRGRKAQSGLEVPRRKEKKKEEMVDAQEQKSTRPAQKKSRISSGRKTVATRSMLRNEAQKKASTTDDHFSQGSKLAEPSLNSSLNVKEQLSALAEADKSADTSTMDNSTSNHGEKVVEAKDISVATETGSKTHDAVEKTEPNSSLNEKEQPSTFAEVDMLSSADTSTVDNSINDHGEKVVEPKGLSVATEAGSKTHDSVQKTQPKDEPDPNKLVYLEEKRESKLETLDGREPKSSKEVEKRSHSGDCLPQEVEVSKAETEHEERVTEGSASEDAGKDNIAEAGVAESELCAQKKTEEQDPGINDEDTLEAMVANPAEEVVASVHGETEAMAAVEENVVEIVQKSDTESTAITVVDSQLQTEATSPKKLEGISQGELEHEEKEQGANEPIGEDVDNTGNTSSELAIMQGERECIATTEGRSLVDGDAQSFSEVADAFQEGTRSDNKRALEASGVSDDVGKNVFGDEKTPSDPPVEKVEREDSDVVGTPMTGEKSEKVKDASQGEIEHEKPEDDVGIATNAVDYVETASELPVGLGVETSNAVDTNVKPSEMGESENEKQDASGGIKENATEEEQTTIALPVILGDREDDKNTDGGPLVEIDKESSEKMDDVLMGETEVNTSEVGGEDGAGGIEKDVTEVGGEDGAGGIEKDVTEDDQSFPAAQEEIEASETIDSKKENDDTHGETVNEAEQRKNVIPLVQDVIEGNLDTDTENLQVEIECGKQKDEMLQGEAEMINEKSQQAKLSHEVDNDHESTIKELPVAVVAAAAEVEGSTDVEKLATTDDTNDLIVEKPDIVAEISDSRLVKEHENEKIEESENGGVATDEAEVAANSSEATESKENKTEDVGEEEKELKPCETDKNEDGDRGMDDSKSGVELDMKEEKQEVGAP